MKVWLIGLGLALLCAVHALYDNVDHEKVLGTWHVHGIATNCQRMLKHKDNMKIMVANVSKTEAGDIKIATSFPTPHGCKKMELVFTKQEDGKFAHKCEWGEKVVETVETDSENYAIVNIIVKKNGKEKAKVLTMYGRARSVAPETVERFNAAVKEQGLTEEQTIILPNEVACIETTE